MQMQTPPKQETFKIKGEELIGEFKRLVHEGNVRRVIIKHDDSTIAEFPLTLGVAAIVLAPVVAAVGALAALLTECTVVVERTGDGDGTKPT